ncbi:glycoside hydrolase family 3 protein [Amanita thiersii Skay4041]|uniref:xylan 1,4-beta-xylosidase n=1 Tax=Amanita thiersii Skay4041 TaxID=703135 RepID=A0A2A9NXD6_9AGAR|nr:glycoside hydrolase family 3 protein [Amanita thiersii Skay4041]
MAWKVVSRLLKLSSLPVVSALVYSFPDCTTVPLRSSAVCDTSLTPLQRAKSLIEQFTVDELISNTVNLSPGVPRLGIPAYQWWSEALKHGVALSPGVTFAQTGNFSFATSFPQPIVLGATFDDELIKSIAAIISTEARAFNNFGRAGLDFFTPNINPFKDPRWGRGQETPGEDPFRISRYVFNLIQGLQGGINPRPYIKVVADCKHYAAYDLENWMGNSRMSFDALVTNQDLSEYYLLPFQSCVRDAKVASVMCSYNSVNGVPSCANSYLLQTILRDNWGFNDEDGQWVTSDCDAVDNIFSTHHFTSTFPEAVADALKAGTDIDCGNAYSLHLPDAFNQSLITRSDLERALTRQYTSLVRLGYFDPPEQQPYRQLDWSNVNTPEAQRLAYQAALEGIVLLKNDGVLPLSQRIKRLALIGPWANATTQMQGNYQGIAPFLISPFLGGVNAGYDVEFALGATISGTSTAGFAEALTTARSADAIIFAGGIDETVEREGLDRVTIDWPSSQLELISRLGELGKPLIVLQFGAGQIDGTQLKHNKTVNALLWGGYPGQSAGTALFDILTGKATPSGRLPTTQYPADYVNQVPMTDMTLRPASANPGRTYIWYQGAPVFEFGFGLHYTTFNLSWQEVPAATYSISTLVRQGQGGNLDLLPFDTFTVTVRNDGELTSDYVAMLYIRGDGGPEPRPNKQLISYERVRGIQPSRSGTASLAVNLGSVARADEMGNLWIFPGTYELAVDTSPVLLSHQIQLMGDPAQITFFPQEAASK